MITISEYVKVNQSVSFDSLPFNEVDLVCLNELAYFPSELFNQQDSLTLSELRAYYQERKDSIPMSFMLTKERIGLLEEILDSQRYADLCFFNAVNEISSEFEKQFAAMVCHIPSINHWQLVFRGTDDSLIGWKEDFKLTYMSEIPAHRSAVAYLKNFLENANYPLYVTGHSKGGNLAVYAASQQDDIFQEKIKGIYKLDAPGFNAQFLESDGYISMKNKIIDIRPKESIIGVMLQSDSQPIIVDASKDGMWQHLVTTWKVSEQGYFMPAEPTELSTNLNKTFDQWITEFSKPELKLLVDTFFDSFIDNGISSLDDLSKADGLKKIWMAVEQMNHLAPSKKALFQKSSRLLFRLMMSNVAIDWPVDDWLKGLKKK